MANIATETQRCLLDCARTFHREHGEALPGGPFPGTWGEPGDVRRCEHGRIWGFASTGTFIDLWEPVSVFWTPIRYLRAARALRPSPSTSTPKEA